MKKVITLIALSVFLFAKNVTIGVILPLSGSLAKFGKESKKGLELAYLQKNILSNGDSVKLLIRNDRSDKADARDIAKKIINEKKASAIIGEISSTNSLAIANIANYAKTPTITPAATNIKVTWGKKYITRACISDPYQGSVMARWAIKHNLKTAVLITSVNEEFSKDVSKVFKTMYRIYGGQIVRTVIIDSKEKDFSSQIQSIKESPSDVIVFTNYYPEVAKMVNLIKQEGIKSVLLGTDAVNYPEFIDLAKDASEGFTAIGHFSSSSAKTQEAKDFIESFYRKYKEKPTYMAALSADAYNMLIDAIESCIDSGKGSANKACINSNLRDLKDFSAITGIISIDNGGNAIKPVPIYRVKEGKFAYIETLNPPQEKEKK